MHRVYIYCRPTCPIFDRSISTNVSFYLSQLYIAQSLPYKHTATLELLRQIFLHTRAQKHVFLVQIKNEGFSRNFVGGMAPHQLVETSSGICAAFPNSACLNNQRNRCSNF